MYSCQRSGSQNDDTYASSSFCLNAHYRLCPRPTAHLGALILPLIAIPVPFFYCLKSPRKEERLMKNCSLCGSKSWKSWKTY
jgi:hypothetical protein